MNCVAPGSTDTPLARAAQAPAEQAAILTAIPLGRYAAPGEIAAVIATLLDETRTAYVTGRTWTVDGGQTTGAGRTTAPAARPEKERDEEVDH